MKILMVASYLPYPLLSGGQVRLYNLIKELSAKHEITLVCEKRPNQTAEDIRTLEKYCNKVVVVDRRKQWSVKNILKTAISPHSFLLNGHTLPEMQAKIQALLLENFDVIHVETYYVMQNVIEARSTNQESKKIPLVLVEHNIEYQVYERFKEKSPVAIKPLLAIDINKIKNEETVFWNAADKVVAVTERDRLEMSQYRIQAALVSNGVNTEQFYQKDLKKPSEVEKRILFIGDFSWIQNKDTISWILREIWPLIKSEYRTQNPEYRIKLWIVSRKIPESIRKLTDDPDVLFDEKSSALPTDEIFRKAYLLLTPIRVGGGSSYKILESMSSGTPVVTMNMSAESIGAEDGKAIMTGQTAEEIAKKTIHLLQDIPVYKNMSNEGRKLIENNFSWKQISKKLEEVYENVI